MNIISLIGWILVIFDGLFIMLGLYIANTRNMWFGLQLHIPLILLAVGLTLVTFGSIIIEENYDRGGI